MDVEVKWKNKMSGNYSMKLLHGIYERIDTGNLNRADIIPTHFKLKG